MDDSSPQGQWLRSELTAHPSTCTLAYWHHPLFSSGKNGDNPQTRPLWQALFEHGADVILSGHDHLYERFAPQDPAGRPDPTHGIREFVVGTGGAMLAPPVRIHANSDVQWNLYGVLELGLTRDAYTWRFISDRGAVADVGTNVCR
jgi:hypothetical protein